MPINVPFNPNNINYTGPRVETGQAFKFQSYLIATYDKDLYIADAKEIKGGFHHVEYLSELTVTKYSGIQTSKRVKNMLCSVEFNDDGSESGKIYRLKTLPGNLLSHWEEIGSGSPITINNPKVVANLTARDALTAVVNDFVTVIDARSPTQIAATSPPVAVYAASYIYNGTGWVIIYPYGQDPNSHPKNNDTQLVRLSNSEVLTADSIGNHISNSSIHKNLNDLNNNGATNEDWSSSKIKIELDKKVNKLSDGLGNLFLSDNGSYKAVSTSGSGTGLLNGDILNGGDSTI